MADLTPLALSVVPAASLGFDRAEARLPWGARGGKHPLPWDAACRTPPCRGTGLVLWKFGWQRMERKFRLCPGQRRLSDTREGADGSAALLAAKQGQDPHSTGGMQSGNTAGVLQGKP